MAAPHVPVAIFSARVNPDGVMIEADAANLNLPIRITMAAIDPTPGAAPDDKADSQRSTVWIHRDVNGLMDSDEEDSDEEDEHLQALADCLNNDSDEDSDDVNGGPSDPSRSKKARQMAAIEKLVKASKEEESDEEMNGASALPNGKNTKGKAKANGADAEDDRKSDSSDEELNLEKTIICTLDNRLIYQQPLDITISPRENVWFSVSGTYPVYVSGNYLVPAAGPDFDHDHDDDSDEETDEDMLALDDLTGMAGDDISDELDDIDGIERIKEIDTDEDDDEEPVPKLVEIKRGKNKRPAEEGTETLDDMMVKEEPRLSKKQLKKLKNNKGEAVAKEAVKQPETPSSAKSDKSDKSDKKVQFAKNLEQGPTGPAKDTGPKKLAVKVVDGLSIDDRKLGTGRTAKDGDKVGMRYIGRLENGRQFDANKKGPPFSFRLGKGEVIKGWDIGIKGMAVGGERRLIIPARHGYGKKGAPPDIPPNATLVFDVKLLEIK